MSATTGETIALLQRVPVFSALGEDELAHVAEVAVPRRFDAGEVVFREGDESNTCYIVRSGRARAIREHGDGRALTLAHFGPGDIFGELAMFDDENCTVPGDQRRDPNLRDDRIKGAHERCQADQRCVHATGGLRAPSLARNP